LLPGAALGVRLDIRQAAISAPLREGLGGSLGQQISAKRRALDTRACPYGGARHGVEALMVWCTVALYMTTPWAGDVEITGNAPHISALSITETAI
jgi:hypothetical protein